MFNDDNQKAYDCIDKGLLLLRDWPKLLVLRASLLRKEKNFEEALSDLENASKNMTYNNMTFEVKKQIALTYNEMGKQLYHYQK